MGKYNETPFLCQLKKSVDNFLFLEDCLPNRIIVSGMLCSKDIVKRNLCDCSTGAYMIESYLLCTSVEPAVDAGVNEVEISGRIVDSPKKIKTDNSQFYSTRMKLDNRRGFISFTCPSDEGLCKDTIVSVKGRLKIKDYVKYTECRQCHKKFAYPMASFLVIADDVDIMEEL
jgi:hypothetical protein